MSRTHSQVLWLQLHSNTPGIWSSSQEHWGHFSWRRFLAMYWRWPVSSIQYFIRNKYMEFVSLTFSNSPWNIGGPCRGVFSVRGCGDVWVAPVGHKGHWGKALSAGNVWETANNWKLFLKACLKGWNVYEIMNCDVSSPFASHHLHLQRKLLCREDESAFLVAPTCTHSSHRTPESFRLEKNP